MIISFSNHDSPEEINAVIREVAAALRSKGIKVGISVPGFQKGAQEHNRHISNLAEKDPMDLFDVPVALVIGDDV